MACLFPLTIYNLKVHRDPSEVFSIELLTKAPIQVLLGAVCWLLPISAIAPPSSLVAVAGTILSPNACPNVASLNFSRENDWSNFNSPPTGSLSTWKYDSGGRYLADSSSGIDRITAMLLASDKAPPSPHNPCPEGGNCSLSISFHGPSFQCEEREDFDSTSTGSLDLLPPSGHIIFMGFFDRFSIDPRTMTLAEESHNTSIQNPEQFWIGYVRNTTKPSKTGSSNATLWPFELERRVLKCSLHRARYIADLSFKGDRQEAKQIRVDTRRPVIPEGEIVGQNSSTYNEIS
jgi:hypothetical protein